jgi:hypothetical protein
VTWGKIGTWWRETATYVGGGVRKAGFWSSLFARILYAVLGVQVLVYLDGFVTKAEPRRPVLPFDISPGLFVVLLFLVVFALLWHCLKDQELSLGECVHGLRRCLFSTRCEWKTGLFFLVMIRPDPGELISFMAILKLGSVIFCDPAQEIRVAKAIREAEREPEKKHPYAFEGTYLPQSR